MFSLESYRIHFYHFCGKPWKNRRLPGATRYGSYQVPRYLVPLSLHTRYLVRATITRYHCVVYHVTNKNKGALEASTLAPDASLDAMGSGVGGEMGIGIGGNFSGNFEGLVASDEYRHKYQRRQQ